MSMPPDSSEQIFSDAGKQEGLLADLAIVRRHWRMIAVVVVASVALFTAIHESHAKSYAATASVTFQNNTLLDSALNISTATSSEPQREADTEVLIAHSAEVADAVRKQLGLTGSASELLEEVKVEAAPTADVLNIIATTHNPNASALLANAFASRYIAFRAKSQLAGISTDESRLRGQLGALPATSPERATLEQSLLRLSSLQAVAASGTSVIGRATPPSSPSGGGLSESVALGFLIGIAIALSLVFLLESLDRRVKTVSEFERRYGLPALVGVPHTTARTIHPESSVLLEPYRILRSALGFTAATRQLNTLLVTSAVAGEGKTTVAVNLARVIALGGRRTVLVELDLRRPMTFGPLDLSARRGVTTAITGSAELSTLLVKPLADLPNLLVLPSGALPHNPSELLGTPRVAEMLAELAGPDSMVIIDTPPLNPVADAHVLLDNPVIDAAIIVARVERTTRDQVRHARSILDHHKVQPVGLVVTGVRDPSRYGYDYGSYEATPDPYEVARAGDEASPARDGAGRRKPDETTSAREEARPARDQARRPRPYETTRGRDEAARPEATAARQDVEAEPSPRSEAEAPAARQDVEAEPSPRSEGPPTETGASSPERRVKASRHKQARAKAPNKPKTGPRNGRDAASVKLEPEPHGKQAESPEIQAKSIPPADESGVEALAAPAGASAAEQASE
jgi:capsular exopolysaccharide synthesis family protein